MAASEVYKIRNIKTGLFWINGRWAKYGKVWSRASDVTMNLTIMLSIGNDTLKDVQVIMSQTEYWDTVDIAEFIKP